MREALPPIVTKNIDLLCEFAHHPSLCHSGLVYVLLKQTQLLLFLFLYHHHPHHLHHHLLVWRACCCLSLLPRWEKVIPKEKVTPLSLLLVLCVQSCLTLCDVNSSHQAPLPMGFSRQEYWNGLPFPTTRDLHDPGIKLESPVSPELAGRFFNHWAT